MGRRSMLGLLLLLPSPGWAISGSDADWSWRSTKEDDGPPVSWVDLDSLGATSVGLSSTVTSATLSLPFSFPFYGTDYTEITVFSYGVIVPGSGKTGPGAWTSGTCLSSTTFSEPLIAPLWTTYDLSRGGSIRYQTYDDAIIIEWDGVYVNATDTGSQYFGVILYSSGEIGYSYLKTSTGNTSTRSGRSATSGVSSGSGDVVQLGCASSYLESSNDSVYITPWGTRHFVGDLTLDDVQDAVVEGTAASDRLGYSISALGDQDSDGAAELLIGAPYNDDAASNAGAVYLLSGADLTGAFSATYADATFTGDTTNDQLGASVSRAGDIDGDGIDDVLLGAPYSDRRVSNGGVGALFLGGSLSGDLTLDDADALYTGTTASDYAGWAVSDAGDVDGDGYDDLLIGAPYQDSGGTSAGAAYLVLGGSAPASTVLSGADAIWTGEKSSDYAGSAVSSAGDVDGDGYDDILIGAYGNDTGGSGAGAVYVVAGSISPSGTTSLSKATRITGAAAGDAAGISATGGGDLDGDGFSDLFVGAYSAGTASAGAAYLLYGNTSASYPSSLASDDGTLSGATSDRLGYALAALDLGGDGGHALVSGAYGSSVGASAAGLVYVTEVDRLDGSTLTASAARGRLISADSSAFYGFSVAVADFNGDGQDDIATGGYGADGDYTASGAVSVVMARPTYPDDDGDGQLPTSGGGLDCDDDDASIGPGNAEDCDGIDNDCDGDVDEDFADTDGDGIADCVDVEECDGLDNDGDGAVDEGMSDVDGDGLCDDLDTEDCDGIDNTGEGDVDEGFPDNDGDGIANCVDVEECDGYDNDGDGLYDEDFADTDGDGIADCVDGENCDGLDNDGDGFVDEDFPDTDSDGIADCVDAEECDGRDNDGDGAVDEGMSDVDGDGLCDDLDEESCDGIDNDGDGRVDEDFEDNDGDGTADCIDGEDCDGIDNNGDGTVDEGYRDNDGDGIANCVDVEECDGIDNDGDGFVDEGSPDADFDGLPDCVDVEECDGIDNNGDGLIDEGAPDADGDGAADCIDAEECDGVDNDGDGAVDEGFMDRDGDGTADCVDPEPERSSLTGTDPVGCAATGRSSGGWLALALGVGLASRRRRRTTG